ncbi:hypothetical protein [Arenibaculum sp.]|jgi:hypothetical protein|uniref:hypothetical protein n=1 Tax=Arenibaculum sp. TaxID=2865862 RepID=UPI002E0E166B|nr:hypothetical protein [Arenibaculum sp.]
MTPPVVIPALVAAGVALAVVGGGPREERQAAAGIHYPVTLYLPEATYDALAKEGRGMQGIQDRAMRLLVEATGR